MAAPLSISFTTTLPQSAATLVLYADETGGMGDLASALWQQSGLDFSRLAKATGFAGKRGHVIDIVAPTGLPCERLLILGRGAGTLETEIAAWADRGGSLYGKLEAAGAVRAHVVLDDSGVTAEMAAALAAGIRLRAYRFDKYKARATTSDTTVDLTVQMPQLDGVDKAFQSAMSVVDGTFLARDLTNEPPNHLGPQEMADAARQLSDLGVSVEILDETDMARLGMGSLLAVGQGSTRPPRLAVLQWQGGTAGDAPLAIVGKGVVFDTGGVSLKPAADMDAMKGDMAGAAAVLGLIKTLATRRAPINVVGVVALVENMNDGNAYRPGDILTAMSGKTIEVINTDAEGRLILADALWYTQDRFKPHAMIDLATLTGAMLIAMGHDFSGVFTNTPALAEHLVDAGFATGEKVWHWPMSPAYAKLIESRFADIKNQGGRKGGAIIAAQFLSNFVNDVPWAHIDIVGTAFGAPSSETNTSWASGFGVALLDRFIRDNYEKPTG